MIINGIRNKNNIEFRKIYAKWKSMMNRCYNQNDNNYYKYGELGIYVCDRWHTFDNFIEDFDKIDGFNYDDFIKGKLALDKDKKYVGNKEYSLEKCSLISAEENNKYKPHQQKIIIGIDKDNNKYEFYNQSEFARQHGLRQSSIGDCLNGKCKTHKGWKFTYKNR